MGFRKEFIVAGLGLGFRELYRVSRFRVSGVQTFGFRRRISHHTLTPGSPSMVQCLRFAVQGLQLSAESGARHHGCRAVELLGFNWELQKKG